MEVGYLDWALADFSGYIAADELYDGPFCVLSVVDNRTFKRLIYQVLDHDPNHDVTLADRRTLQRITRRLPQLRSLRSLMEEVYRLFDRRCRTDTALAKLAKLRQRVRRFKEVGKVLNKLQSPNLEKTLTFLDDKLLPSTSNAVERGNRRHRKMQKTVYRVRTQKHISNRIALDMLRDSQKEGRTKTQKVLHHVRTGTMSQ